MKKIVKRMNLKKKRGEGGGGIGRGGGGRERRLFLLSCDQLTINDVCYCQNVELQIHS